MRNTDSSRRDFLAVARGTGAGLLAAALAEAAPGQKAKKTPEPEEEVAPGEDLMREHGVLNRILLIYEEGLRRLDAGKDFAPEILSGAAGIVRRFIEEYHEKLEEENLFPRFEKAGKLVDLVAVLREQHRAGRRLTAEIERLTRRGAVVKEEDRRRLSDSMRLFIRMYRPHEAREDTVLFPAFHTVVSRKEYESLGDAFEGEEHRLFGAEGFEKIVAEVAGLEKPLGIYELSRFTPK